MEYSTFQIIILLDDTLNINKKRCLAKEIRHFIEKSTKKINIRYEETRKLAYPIDGHDKAWFIAMQIKLKSIGSNKRIKEIQEKLNTYEEIIKFDIVQKDKEDELIENNNEIYIVYEFDYGDISHAIEPNVTLFDCYTTREKAVEKAMELLNESSEEFFIEADFKDIENPFEIHNVVELYREKEQDEQESCVYCICIEKIKLI